jgi:hypothetical protein
MAEIGEPLRRRVLVPQTLPTENPYVDNPPPKTPAPVEQPAEEETVE